MSEFCMHLDNHLRVKKKINVLDHHIITLITLSFLTLSLPLSFYLPDYPLLLSDDVSVLFHQTGKFSRTLLGSLPFFIICLQVFESV